MLNLICLRFGLFLEVLVVVSSKTPMGKWLRQKVMSNDGQCLVQTFHESKRRRRHRQTKVRNRHGGLVLSKSEQKILDVAEPSR